MSSKHPSIRVRGQRSIPLTFIRRTSTEVVQEKLENGRPNKKRPKISLSDFLNRKLQKTSDPSKLVQGKERPFITPGTSVRDNQSIQEPELNGVLDVVLEQFKPSKENEDSVCNYPEESQIQSSNVTHLTEESQIQSTKAFGGLHGKPLAPKALVVLGGDSRPNQTKYQKSFIKNKKPLPLYNHYAGGSGWWDSDMEGIDNEAVGFNEVWEGVGSATLGGLDWH